GGSMKPRTLVSFRGAPPCFTTYGWRCPPLLSCRYATERLSGEKRGDVCSPLPAIACATPFGSSTMEIPPPVRPHATRAPFGEMSTPLNWRTDISSFSRRSSAVVSANAAKGKRRTKRSEIARERIAQSYLRRLRRTGEELLLADPIRMSPDRLAQAARIGNSVQRIDRRRLIRRDQGHVADAEEAVEDGLVELAVVDVAEIDLREALRHQAALDHHALTRHRVERAADPQVFGDPAHE